jgi:peptide deformylase
LTSTAVSEAIDELIGVKKNIIAVNMGMVNVAMINPVITKKTGAYETEEGCLSLQGKRKTTRYKEIEVEFIDMEWKKQKQKYSGWIAQIIQHDMTILMELLSDNCLTEK